MFGLTQLGTEPEFIVSVADTQSTILKHYEWCAVLIRVVVLMQSSCRIGNFIKLVCERVEQLCEHLNKYALTYIEEIHFKNV